MNNLIYEPITDEQWNSFSKQKQEAILAEVERIIPEIEKVLRKQSLNIFHLGDALFDNGISTTLQHIGIACGWLGREGLVSYHPVSREYIWIGG